MNFKKTYVLGVGMLVVFIPSCERSVVKTSRSTPELSEIAAVGAVAKTTETQEVVMLNMAFSPTRVEIAKGETVEWKNNDIVPHTATSPAFGDSGLINPDKTWSHTFKDAGEFPYTCTLHPTMKGSVIVK